MTKTGAIPRYDALDSFEHLMFGHSNLFRISCFGFRIYDRKNGMFDESLNGKIDRK
jgi:hypothetical protein